MPRKKKLLQVEIANIDTSFAPRGVSYTQGLKKMGDFTISGVWDTPIAYAFDELTVGKTLRICVPVSETHELVIVTKVTSRRKRRKTV